MIIRPNYAVAVVFAVIHFLLGLFSAFLNFSEGSTTGGHGSWVAPTFIFTFPLTTILELMHNRNGFGFAGNILAMMVQSFCWGLLFSLLCSKKSS
jgi:hypothetical protein